MYKNIYMSKMKKTKPDEKEPTKVRITTYLDEDILNLLHQMAEDSGGKYQTILNQVLRNQLFGKKEGVLARIERLEKAVFEKR